MMISCPLCNSTKSDEMLMESCSVYNCKNCMLQYIDDKEGKDTNYLENYSTTRKKESAPGKLRQIQYLLDAKHLKNNISIGKILDVGCSTGEFLSTILDISEFQLYGIDTDCKAIDIAKKECDSRINFFNTDLINFETDLKFDCIVFRGSFQFLGSDLQETLEKISKIGSDKLKIVIYSLPNSESVLYHYLKDKWNLFDKKSHTLIFNKNSIMKICDIYKYKISEFSYPYLETAYANLENDCQNLMELIKEGKKDSFPFWGNIMQIILEKE